MLNKYSFIRSRKEKKIEKNNREIIRYNKEKTDSKLEIERDLMLSSIVF